MESAYQLIDIGPGAGEHGGEIIFSGPPNKILKAKDSITGQYLSGIRFISIPEERREGNGKLLSISGASGNNLKKIDVMINLSHCLKLFRYLDSLKFYALGFFPSIINLPTAELPFLDM